MNFHFNQSVDSNDRSSTSHSPLLHHAHGGGVGFTETLFFWDHILDHLPQNSQKHLKCLSRKPEKQYYPLKLCGTATTLTSSHKGDPEIKAGNLRFNEVKSGFEVSYHCQTPPHLTFRDVEEELFDLEPLCLHLKKKSFPIQPKPMTY